MRFLRKFEQLKSHRWQLVIVAVVVVGGFLRFCGLNWGLPYFFHPDERNMASAISRLVPGNLDPDFYAYGQFPLYLAYFSGKLFFFFFKGQSIERLSFNQAILALRFWSAFFSTATIYVAYLVSQKIFSSKKTSGICCSLFSAVAVAFTPGLIQAAHFGTTESVLTFCFLTIVYFSLKLIESPNFKNYFGAAFFLGIALGSKISAAVFAAPLVLATFWQAKKQKPVKKKLCLVFKFLFALAVCLAITVLTSPYLLLAYKESKGTLIYEIAVAQGQNLPFYTRQFFRTVPVVFQFQKIFPYVLGWPIFIFGTLGLFLIIGQIFKKILYRCPLSFPDYCLSVTFFSFFIYFLPNAFLFTKWTRFMTPILPFFSIFSAYLFSKLLPWGKKAFTGCWLLLTGLCLIPGLIFFQIYLKPDIRFVASDWIYNNIPSSSQVLSETANVVDIPILFPDQKLAVNNYQLSPVSFNFYDLDESPKMFERLLDELVTSDYILIPSRRLFANHLRLPERYPLASRYYQLLFSGQLGFKEIKTFYPFLDFKINNWSLRIDDEQSEETFTVFDHPVIRIYKKDIPQSRNNYESLFKIQ